MLPLRGRLFRMNLQVVLASRWMQGETAEAFDKGRDIKYTL